VVSAPLRTAAKDTATRQVKLRMDPIRASLDIVPPVSGRGPGGVRLIVQAAATDALPNGYRPAVPEFRILGLLADVGPIRRV
jgi:hypothetical protein